MPDMTAPATPAAMADYDVARVSRGIAYDICRALGNPFPDDRDISLIATRVETGLVRALTRGGIPEPVRKQIERILDEHSAWIARPSTEVTDKIALACTIAALHIMSETDGFASQRAAEAEAREAALRAAVEGARDWAQRIAHDERVCGWLHAQDYSLYCLLADCPVDFDATLAAQPGEALAVVREMQGAIAATLASNLSTARAGVISSLASAEESARRLFGEPQA